MKASSKASLKTSSRATLKALTSAAVTGGAALLFAGACPAAPPAADQKARFSPPSTEISPLDDLTRAKMDLQSAQINRDSGLWDDSNSNADNSQCGTVSIGSSSTASNQATSRVLPSSTTIIVTGSIVNSANCGY